MTHLRPTGHPSVGTDVRRPPADLEVVIPAFDEEERLGVTLRDTADVLSAQSWSSRIVVVDDGSTDRTAEVADRVGERFPVRVIGCSRRGKGAAVRRGILTSPARWVGYCDADEATPAALIVPAMELLTRGHPIVIGSRYCAGGRVAVRQPLLRRLGSRGFRSLSRRLVGDLADTQCGFKFFDAALARRLFTQCHTTGFAFDLELLMLAHRAHVPVVELPVDWYDQHGSTVRSVRDGLRAYRELLSFRLLGADAVDVLTLDPGLLTDCVPDEPSAAPELSTARVPVGTGGVR